MMMPNVRGQLEEYEKRFLASYAIKSQDTKGRVYPEVEPANRTVFQRDRDRILHTSAFRRLEYKTQVFINYEGDYFRTRLTHTLEVSQIARTLARALRANEDLVEAICVAHDLGHPPFGHSGEVTLNELLVDFGGFDHNKQSLRILTKLEHRYLDFHGLNLTWEVREGIVKHETEYDIADAEDYDPELRGHLEAQIANVADELAYTAHDLDDGLRSNMISSKQLSEISLWVNTLNTLEGRPEEFDELTRHRFIRRLIGIEVEDVIHATSKSLKESRVNSPEMLQRMDHNIVTHSPEIILQNEELKNFLYQKLYRHYRVVRMAVKAERILTELFNAYKSEPEILPPKIQEQINQRPLERVVCDYIAGMTDRYAIEEYQKLYSPTTRP